ncbi:hypothetical protein GGU10DRAFT_336574 [Lentinula aff. detonsa]|uniref:Uncharacterized protein n=1 Tax=Lentinula aff. detonsa TaxID=2804958 RepID=A0AA38L366_9AGAR|nr:hypothetical protein GGU10DRAFT_336574 [Lentinula aff. detonsa]
MSLWTSCLGFASLEILIPIVEATIGAKWKRDGLTAEILTEVDADIVQAIQSCKEEVLSDRVKERGAARQIVNRLQRGVEDSTQEGALVLEKAADTWVKIIRGVSTDSEGISRVDQYSDSSSQTTILRRRFDARRSVSLPDSL